MYVVIVVVTMYLYAACAKSIFSDSEQFSTALKSFITMFQLLIGEGWHDVMYEESNKTASVNT